MDRRNRLPMNKYDIIPEPTAVEVEWKEMITLKRVHAGYTIDQ